MILEFKVIDGGDPLAAVEQALDQIEAKKYATEPRALGASVVHLYGLVFDGKKMWLGQRVG